MGFIKIINFITLLSPTRLVENSAYIIIVHLGSPVSLLLILFSLTDSEPFIFPTSFFTLPSFLDTTAKWFVLFFKFLLL